MKGLKFCPTPDESQDRDSERDINDFCRKLRLSEFFTGRQNTDQSIVMPKSSWVPDAGRNHFLDTGINYLKMTQETQKNRVKKTIQRQ